MEGTTEIRTPCGHIDGRECLRAACLAVLLTAAWIILGHKVGNLGLGGEILFLTLGFGFIPDLVDGNGEEGTRSGGLSKLESEIRSLLDNLGEGFLVLHDLESPHGTIRHVVFSRGAGVVLIEAMPDRNRIALDHASVSCAGCGSGLHVLDVCTARAYWLRDRITEIVGEKPWISPILVVPNAFVPQDFKADGVHIVSKSSLASTLSAGSGRRRKSSLIWDARGLIADSLRG